MKDPIADEDILNRLHILIVDDMLNMRSFMRECMKIVFPSSICHEAENGADAIKLLKTKLFDVILCDWELPDIKGDEILRWIRTESSYKEMPFLMVTARDDKQSIVQAMSLGVTDYVVKPLNCELLGQKMRLTLPPKWQRAFVNPNKR
jgi:DNA-binding response OmpR family regulator